MGEHYLKKLLIFGGKIFHVGIEYDTSEHDIKMLILFHMYRLFI